MSKKTTMKARKSILDTLKKSSISPSDPIGVGVSGGADSSSLLFALSTIYHHETAKLVHVIIVDHQLQEVTAEVAVEVKNLAESLGFHAYIRVIDVNNTGLGTEADARNARYTAFNSAIEEFNLKGFLLGHTKNDQAEQVFLGLLRGSGTRSLSGIPEKRGVFIRPYLNTLTRKETEAVCVENNYDYWCDPHNDSSEYRRVIVRKVLKNIDEETGQSLVEPLVRTAKISSEDADALEYFAFNSFAELEMNDWAVDKLKFMPIAIRKRVYKLKLEEISGSDSGFGSVHLGAIDDLIVNWNGQKALNMPNNVSVKRVDEKIVFHS